MEESEVSQSVAGADGLEAVRCDNEHYGLSLAQRLAQFRCEGIGCDVEFIVGAEQKIIEAHRLVLGCGSKVFAAMFYGKMAQQGNRNEGRMRVDVPDVTPHAFTTLINFFYSDLSVEMIKLNDDVVMQTLYAAKKYDVKALILICVRYLMGCLNADNAVCLFAQARFFDEPILTERCLHVIDMNTDRALASSGFRDIDRDTLSIILERSQLDPSNELVIFKAAWCWSEAECERRGIDVNPANQREVLGPVLSLIRFPLMNVYEFGEAASSSLLTCEEIAEVFLHLTVVPRPPVSYPSNLRCCGRSRHVVKRFPALSPKRCNKRENKLCFMADRDILVSGFGIFGFVPSTKPHIYLDPSIAVEWQTEVEIQLTPTSDFPAGPVKLETVVIQGVMGDANPIIAKFSTPVPVRSNVYYVAGMKFVSEAAVQTYGGKDGVETATISLPFDEEVKFHFQSFKNCYNSEDACRFEGQLPEIHFFVQWPEGKH